MCVVCMMMLLRYQGHSKSILNTSHSLMRNCPFGCPVNAKLDSGERIYLPLLQLIGNSAFDRSLLPLSTMQMSQHPKIGPLSGLFAIANCARFKLNFSRMFSEKMNDFRDLSAAHCFFAELHAIGVYPPMTFPNSVSTRVRVPAWPSHFLWNSRMEQAFSEARKRSLREAILESKRRLMAAKSDTTLLLSAFTCALTSATRVVCGLSLRVPGLRQRSEARSSSSDISSCSAATSLSIILGVSTLRCEVISERMGAMQLPVTWAKLPSVRFLMNFMTSMLEPQVLTHRRNLACSERSLPSSCRNMLSTFSLKYANSCVRKFGLSYTSPSISDHSTFSHSSWNRQHSSRAWKPASQMSPGLRQLGLVHTAKTGLPYTHSAPCSLP